jgi:SAM-dependent methyltransferase
MKYKQLLSQFVTVAVASGVFMALLRWMGHPTDDLLLLPYSMAFLGLMTCTLGSTAASLVVSNSNWSAGRLFLPGLVATHLPLMILGFGALILIEVTAKESSATSMMILAALIAIASLISARVWVFLTPVLRDVHYEEIPADFYQDTTKEEHVGSFRAWYHGGRYKELQAKVESLYTPGDCIYDFGCGSAEWNRSKLPVIGADVSRALLQSGLDRGHLSDIVVTELDRTGLPDDCADLIIISEVLEHIIDPARVLAEIHRCLKPGGRLLLTVPWDTPFSPFFWLFNVQCFYRGYVLGEDYYRQRCGHVNHFSLRALRALLVKTGFSVQQMYRFRGFLLYSISTK